MNSNRARYGGPQGAGREKRINAKQFLGKQEGIAAYSNQNEYGAYLDSLRDDEAEDLKKFFSCVKEELRFSNLNRVRIDVSGRRYLYPVPIRPKGGSGLKVILEAGMTRFIEDYVNGKVLINFELDELAEEAFNV